MSIYLNDPKRVNYRKLWEQYNNCKIPKDATGRTYDIHHIDGNRNNNSKENLYACSIEEHYNIHHNQGDWGACKKIAIKMQMSTEVISELASKAQLKRVEEGTHHFLGGDLQRKNSIKRVEKGTHNFLGRSEEIRKWNLKRSAEGTHPWKDKTRASERNKKLIAEGAHYLLNSITCRDKNGNVVQVPKETYYNQKQISVDPTDWEFVTIRSKEGVRRKINN